MAPEPERAPVFVRTNWLFIEIDEALERINKLTTLIKIARLNNEVQTAARLTADLVIITGQLSRLAGFANEQFAKEV